jgi:hypothetical protein
LLVERRLPWLPDDTAALALATFRSLTRAPELKLALIAPVIMGVVISSMWLARSHHPPGGALSAFLATAAIATVSFSLAPTMANVFGLDRNGFRALVLLPTRRHHILLAKNLAFFPFVGGAACVLILLAKFLGRTSWLAVLVGLVQLPAAFLLFSLLYNTLSILAPYRLSQGTLKAKQPRAIVFVAAFGALLLTPVVLIPILIPPALQLVFSGLGWLPWLPVNLLAAAVILAAVVGLYGAVPRSHRGGGIARPRRSPGPLVMGHFGGARLPTSRLARTLAPPKTQADPLPASCPLSKLFRNVP